MECLEKILNTGKYNVIMLYGEHKMDYWCGMEAVASYISDRDDNQLDNHNIVVGLEGLFSHFNPNQRKSKLLIHSYARDLLSDINMPNMRLDTSMLDLIGDYYYSSKIDKLRKTRDFGVPVKRINGSLRRVYEYIEKSRKKAHVAAIDSSLTAIPFTKTRDELMSSLDGHIRANFSKFSQFPTCNVKKLMALYDGLNFKKECKPPSDYKLTKENYEHFCRTEQLARTDAHFGLYRFLMNREIASNISSIYNSNANATLLIPMGIAHGLKLNCFNKDHGRSLSHYLEKLGLKVFNVICIPSSVKKEWSNTLESSRSVMRAYKGAAERITRHVRAAANNRHLNFDTPNRNELNKNHYATEVFIDPSILKADKEYCEGRIALS